MHIDDEDNRNNENNNNSNNSAAGTTTPVVVTIASALSRSTSKGRSSSGSRSISISSNVLPNHSSNKTNTTINATTASSSSVGNRNQLLLQLPVWMEEYIAWHHRSLQSLRANRSEWQNYDYLVIRCLKSDAKCGGLADRLRPLPLAVLAAAFSQPRPRLLFIHWERPAPLQEFLVPPSTTTKTNSNNNNPLLDWRIPSWLLQGHYKFNKKEAYLIGTGMLLDQLIGVASTTTTTVSSSGGAASNGSTGAKKKKPPQMLDWKIQAYSEAEKYYNTHQQQLMVTMMMKQQQQQQSVQSPILLPDFNTVLGVLWHRLFQPTAPVQNLLDQQRTGMGLSLKPGEGRGHDDDYYVAAHCRTRYVRNRTPQSFLQQQVHNAVNCAAKLAAQSRRQQHQQQQQQKEQQQPSPPSSTLRTAKIPQPPRSFPPPKILFVSDSSEANAIAVAYGRGLVVAPAVAAAASAPANTTNNNTTAVVLGTNNTTSNPNNNNNNNTNQQPIPAAEGFVTNAAAAVAGSSIGSNTDKGIKGRQQQQQLLSPVHLDRGSAYLSRDPDDWTEFPPERYYSIFVDLYLLAQSRCVTWNVGGFGTLGMILSEASIEDPKTASEGLEKTKAYSSQFCQVRQRHNHACSSKFLEQLV